VREVPTMEVTVAIRIVWFDILHGGFGEGRDGVGRTAGGPNVRTGVKSVGGTVGK
jgi:hypothetical protein